VVFWQHVYVKEPDQLAVKTLSYQEEFGLSWFKLMPDVPIGFAERSITSWNHIVGFQGGEEFAGARDYVAAARQVRRKGSSALPVWATVFTPLGLLGLWSDSQLLVEFNEVDAGLRHSVLRALTRATEHLIEELCAVGVDGIYLSAWGSDILSHDDYISYGVPYDLWVMETARRVGEVALHIHGGKGLQLGLYTKCAPSIVGWSESESGIRWEEGMGNFEGARLLGGIDEKGPFNEAWLVEQKRRISALRQTLGAQFIIGPGCSLPLEVPNDYLKELGAC